MPGSSRPHSHLSQFLQVNTLVWLMGCVSGDSKTFRTRRSCQAFQVSAPPGGWGLSSRQWPPEGSRDRLMGLLCGRTRSGLGEPPENTRGRTPESTHRGRKSRGSERKGGGLIHILEALRNFNKGQPPSSRAHGDILWPEREKLRGGEGMQRLGVASPTQSPSLPVAAGVGGVCP